MSSTACPEEQSLGKSLCIWRMHNAQYIVLEYLGTDSRAGLSSDTIINDIRGMEHCGLPVLGRTSVLRGVDVLLLLGCGVCYFPMRCEAPGVGKNRKQMNEYKGV